MSSKSSNSFLGSMGRSTYAIIYYVISKPSQVVGQLGVYPRVPGPRAATTKWRDSCVTFLFLSDIYKFLNILRRLSDHFSQIMKKT